MKAEYLFVYGTLRRGCSCEVAHLLERHADFVGEGRYQGRLYKVDYYPGVVPSENQEDQVPGDIYRLPEPSSVLSQIDQYEECGPGFPEPTLFIRKKQEVCQENGERHAAWIYLYNRDTAGLEIVDAL